MAGTGRIHNCLGTGSSAGKQRFSDNCELLTARWRSL
jgi:hypothetical protein